MTQDHLLLIVGLILCLTLCVATAALIAIPKKFAKMIESDQKTRGLLRDLIREMKKTKEAKEKEVATQAA